MGSKTFPIICKNKKEKDIKLTLKERIRFLLFYLGKNDAWLSEQIGVSRGKLSRYLDGSWLPSSEEKLKMAKALNTDTLVLFESKQFLEPYRVKTVYLDYIKGVGKQGGFNKEQW